MDCTSVHVFREEAHQQGLLVCYGQEIGRLFKFDLNQGPIVLSNPTPERVMVLVTLARKHAEPDGYGGEHRALLWLVAYVSELESEPRLYWHRPYFVHGSVPVISLRDWLLKNGQNLDEIDS